MFQQFEHLIEYMQALFYFLSLSAEQSTDQSLYACMTMMYGIMYNVYGTLIII